ncbi:MAG: 1,4-dihydroxy-2-naphthoate octaprenyltransferase, partial [Dehalococcoidia bacterium]|nr:1,4-dihydroxy-2-naphthoate octaprenyltransferase [Dehalococcoidia bacterium]
FNFYVASMKGDPKTLQMTRQPSISILVSPRNEDINTSREIEITGATSFITDPDEKRKALEITAVKSPVVKYMKETGNEGMLDYIKISPETIKYRIFGEIVQGIPPTVLEFPGNVSRVSDWSRLKMKLHSWWMELRPSFLTASIVPVLLGSAVAWSVIGSFNFGYFLLALLAGILMQAGTNIINDYFDHSSGNDEANVEFIRPFSGGSRLIQLGLMSPLEVLAEALICFVLATAIGLFLAWTRGPFLLILGAIAILSGFFYSGKPFNWSSRGLGELIVGLNFGPLMALGAYYVQTQSLSWLPVLASLPVAFLISAVLYINEFPDFNADNKVGRKTWVVRLGKQKAVTGFGVLLTGAYVVLVGGIITGQMPAVTAIALVTLPLAVKALLHAWKHYDSSFDLAPANGLMVTSHLATGLFLTLAYLWQSIGSKGWVYMFLAALGCLAFILYMYWYIERQKRVFHGLKQAVSGGN